MYGKIVIRCELKVLTGMHIGASGAFSAIGAVDSPVVRPRIIHGTVPGVNIWFINVFISIMPVHPVLPLLQSVPPARQVLLQTFHSPFGNLRAQILRFFLEISVLLA